MLRIRLRFRSLVSAAALIGYDVMSVALIGHHVFRRDFVSYGRGFLVQIVVIIVHRHCAFARRR